MVHAIITLIVCIVVILTGLPVWCCLLPAFWYMGREFAQAEYRYIDAFCDGKRERMPWYAGFLPAAWTVKGMLDWILPSVVSMVFIFCYS